MKSKKAHSTRKHGLSRLERLLEASIRHELQIKAMRRELLELSARLAISERLHQAVPANIENEKQRELYREFAGEVWPYEPFYRSVSSGLDRNKP